MQFNEIRNILSSILENEFEDLDVPTDEEWDMISKKLNCSFLERKSMIM